MPTIVPIDHSQSDVERIKNEAVNLLNTVKGFSFSHEIELVKAKLLEVVGALDQELSRLNQVLPELTASRPFTDAEPTAVTALAGPSGTAEEEKALEASAAQTLSDNPVSTEGALTNANAVVVEPVVPATDTPDQPAVETPVTDVPVDTPVETTAPEVPAEVPVTPEIATEPTPEAEVAAPAVEETPAEEAAETPAVEVTEDVTETTPVDETTTPVDESTTTTPVS